MQQKAIRAILCIFISICGVSRVNSQTANFDWIVNAGGNLSDYSRSIAADKNNNFYITGEFEQHALFDTTNLHSANYDLFLAKYSGLDGRLIWIKQATASDDIFGYRVAVDHDNNVYVAGLFLGNLSIGDTVISGTVGLKSSFLAKYDSNGQFLWARSANSDVGASTYHIAVNSLNEVYWLIWFEHTITFTNYSGVDTTLIDDPPIPVRHAVAIAKISSSGSLLYTRKISGNDCVHAKYLHVDNADNYYISGVFYQNANLGDTVILNSNGGSYWAKFNSNNQLEWIKQLNYAGINIICTDDVNNVYLSGVIVPNYVFENVQLSSYGANDIFIAKYNSSGNFIWVKQAGSRGNDNCEAMYAKGNNEFYIGGSFNDTANFNNHNLISKGGSDLYIAMFDSSGNFSYAGNFGSILNDDEISIACIRSGDLLLTGTFKNELFWENDSLTGYGVEDVFVAKLSIPGLSEIQKTKLCPVIHFYPNPSRNYINIAFPEMEGDLVMQLINIFGQTVFTQKIEKTERKTTMQFDISSLFEGVYMVKISGKNYLYSGKLLKK